MHRFFVPKESISVRHVVLSRSQAHQICNVLRLRVGDKIIILDNTGHEYDVALKEVTRNKAIGEILQKRPATGEPSTQLTLYQSILSREKFEWVLQRCTEVGVTRFVPIVTQRSIPYKIDSVTSKKFSRWQHIIQEAAEQSHRGRIPEIRNLIKFQDAIASLDKFDIVVIASPAGKSLHQALGKTRTEPIDIALFIGPEGGFTEQEVQTCCSTGAVTINLGKRILRTETAAVVASALILYELEMGNRQ
jgi:16S rRNA (uracil1498-N3)-methyltransferase